MPFRGDMPDLIFTEPAVRQRLDLKKDFELRCVASPLDAMQHRALALIGGRMPDDGYYDR